METSIKMAVDEDVEGIRNEVAYSSQTISSRPSTTSSLTPSSSAAFATSSIPFGHIISSEATRFSTEITKLSVQLVLAQRRIRKQEAEINEQNLKLEEASDLIADQQRQLDGGAGFSFGQEVEDLKELKNLVALERTKRLVAEEKFAKLRNSVKEMNEEYSQFFEEVKEHLIEGCQQRTSSYSKERLDQLSKFVEQRFEKWMKEQMTLKATVKGMNQVIQNLMEIINSHKFKESRTPPAKDIFTLKIKSEPNPKVLSSQPIKLIREEAMQTTTQVPPKKIVLKSEEVAKEHAEDTSKSHLKRFYCICGVEYTTKSNLIIHIRSLTEEGKFKCQICQEKFVLFYVLRRHLESKHKIKQKKGNGAHCTGCMECGKTFSSMVHLKMHRRSAHSQESAAAVDFEDKNSSTSEQTVAQNDTDKDPAVAPASMSLPGFMTPEITKVSSDTVSMSGKKHGMNIAKRHQGFFCICGIKFISRKSLDGHLRFQNKDTEFSSPSVSQFGVEHHVIPSKPLQCICGFRSTSKQNTAKHVIYHTTERKFLCDLCPKRFLNLNYLRVHYVKSHNLSRKDIALGTGCRKCGLSFETMKEYQEHCKIWKKAVKHESELPEVTTITACSPSPPSSATPFKSEFRRSGLAVNMSRTGLQIIDVRGSINAQDDYEDLYASSPPISPQPVPIYFDDDDNEEMPVMLKVEATDTKPAHSSFTLKEEVEEDSENPSPSDILVEVHQHDTTKRSSFFYCTCGKRLGSKRILTTHIKQKTEKWKFPCTICNKLYFYSSTLKLHMFKIHQILAPGSGSEDTKIGYEDIKPKLETFSKFPQDQKQEDFEEAESSQRNSSHERDMWKQQLGLFYCTCGKNCENEERLQGHIAQIKRELKFPCKLCTEGFPFRSFLTRHLERKHKIEGGGDAEEARSTLSGVRSKSRCTKCRQNFKTQVALLRHNKLFHKMTNIGEAVKSRIKKRKVINANSAHYQVSSSSSDKYRCACGLTYERKSGVRKHISQKSHGKIFKCSHCPKAFWEGVSLRSHTKSMHQIDLKDKRHGCGICGKLFQC